MTQWRDIEHLVHDRLDGALTPEQERSLDAILAREPDLARHATELERVVRGLQTIPHEKAPQDFARGVMQRLAATGAPIARTRGTPWTPWKWGMRSIGPSLLAAAAVVVVAVILARDPSVSAPTDRSVALDDASDRASADGFVSRRGVIAGSEKQLDDAEVEGRRAGLEQPPVPATESLRDEVAQGYGLFDGRLAFRRDELVEAVTAALVGSADKDRKVDAEKHKQNEFGADRLEAAAAFPDVLVVRRIPDEALRAQFEAAADKKERQREPTASEVLDALFGPAENGRAKAEDAKQAPESESELTNDKIEALLASNAGRARRVTLDATALVNLAAKAREAGLELYAWNRSSADAAWKESAAPSGRLGAVATGADAEAVWRKLEGAANGAPAVDSPELTKKPAMKAAAAPAPAPRRVIIVVAQK